MGASTSWDHRATGWMRRQLVTRGSAALMTTGRWTEAENLVRNYRAIGPGLSEGQQTAILGRYSLGDLTSARRLLDDAMLTTGWERQVAANVRLLLATHDERNLAATTVAEMFTRPIDGTSTEPTELHSRMAATATHLLAANRHSAAAEVATAAAQQALAEPDGYAARHLAHTPAVIALLRPFEANALEAIVSEAGLTGEAFNTDVRRRLSNTAYSARKVLADALDASL